MNRLIRGMTVSLLLSFALMTLSCSPCEDTPRLSVPSPDQRIVATFYERGCGATTDFTSMVNVQSKKRKFNGDEAIIFIVKGRYDISIEWHTPTALTIRCAACSRKNVFREVSAFGDIDVSYSLGSDSTKAD